MKFSIIIPVYNVEEYIDKCLDSVLNQTYDNFEVIIVNDGTLDNSQSIINKYVKKDKRFKSYKKENGGLSSARNYGVKYATGNYLLFIDSDDFIELDYLEKISRILKNNDIEILKTNINICDINGKTVRKEMGLNRSGYVKFTDLTQLEFIDSVGSYIYNLDFYKKNNFSFKDGLYHEDFGLMLEILVKAKKVYYFNYYFYNYVIRNDSIMTSNSFEIIKKRAYDMIAHYDYLKDIINSSKLSKKDKDAFIYYMENAVIAKIYNFKGNKVEFKKFKKILKQHGVFKFTCNSSYKYIIKKLILKISINIYIKYILKIKKWNLL